MLPTRDARRDENSTICKGNYRDSKRVVFDSVAGINTSGMRICGGPEADRLIGGEESFSRNRCNPYVLFKSWLLSELCDEDLGSFARTGLAFLSDEVAVIGGFSTRDGMDS